LNNNIQNKPIHVKNVETAKVHIYCIFYFIAVEKEHLACFSLQAIQKFQLIPNSYHESL